MGDIDRSGVVEPNTTDRVMGTRTEVGEPVNGDRLTTNNDDVIIVEPRN